MINNKIVKTDIEDFSEFLISLSEEYDIFLPDSKGIISEYIRGADLYLEKVPSWYSSKEFLLPPRENGIKKEKRKKIIIGLHQCDLKAFEIIEKVFLNKKDSGTDYAVRSRFDNVVLISVDCSIPAESCFCTALGIKPYGGGCLSDINLTVLDNEIHIEPISKNGKKLLKKLKTYGVNERDNKKRLNLHDTARRCIEKNYEQKIKNLGYSNINQDTASWKKESENCIQCGGCNFCCPTCYCHIYDEMLIRGKSSKVRQWDSCQYPGFTYMADEKTGRKELWQRFAYRYICKFELMYNEFGIFGCTGCGRCIKTCPGEIDIRHVYETVMEKNGI